MTSGRKAPPQAEEWTTYTYVDGRKTNTVNSTKQDEQVFAMGEVLKLICNSDDPAILETDEGTQTMGLKAVVRFMEEMTSKKTGKATHRFMSCLDGPRSWKNMTPEEKEASVQKSIRGRPRTNGYVRTNRNALEWGCRPIEISGRPIETSWLCTLY